MNIVVLCAGISTEREVSINTGAKVCEALRSKGHNAVMLDVYFGTKNTDIFEKSADTYNIEAAMEEIHAYDSFVEQTKNNRCYFFGENVIALCQKSDIVFMALHGENGENGKVQAAFDLMGIKYTGTGCLGSGMAMDKGVSKQIFMSNKIPTPKGVWLKKGEPSSLDEIAMTVPCVVKPCCGGSSVGVTIVENVEDYHKALEESFRYEDEVLIEQFVKGREFSIGVIDGKPLPIIEIIPKEGFYDYKNKYVPGMTEEVCPADLTAEQTEEMQKIAVDVYEALKLEAYGRVDVMMEGDGSMYCLEANTLPGMTATSFFRRKHRQSESISQVYVIYLFRNHWRNINKKNGQYLLYKETDMRNMTLANIAKACNGTYYGEERYFNQTITGVEKDSRLIEEGYLFLPFVGNVVDGHQFIPQVFERGALCTLSEKVLEHPDGPYILVESVGEALKRIAEFYREQLETTIIGITGSVEKPVQRK